ncbi:dienelactone hydrolase family protein [Nocardia camponoti]|uniref:dienelactone hydrolase family protein n=1 Tax=Nocardia camponoti TaxID=1616106 RepID=UPI001669F4D0
MDQQPYLSRTGQDAGTALVVRPADDTHSAVVLCHEVFGLTGTIADLAERIAHDTGATVYAPHLLTTGPFRRSEEHTAYTQFMTTMGPSGLAERLLDFTALHTADHQVVHCLGLSVGATAAWIASGVDQFSAVVPVYGSRIRDHMDVQPYGRAHLVFAEHEPSFSPSELASQLRNIDRVTVEILPHHHGFCSTDAGTYSRTGLDHVITTAQALFQR